MPRTGQRLTRLDPASAPAMLVVAAVTAMAAISDGAHAEIFPITPGTADRIQVLIDEVAADGDEIVLLAGDHTVASALDLRGRSILLRGELDRGGAPISRLVGQGATGVLVCRSGETASTVIADLVVTGGDIDLGAGLLVNDASPTIRGVRFQSNRASVFGGGVGVFGSASAPRFEGCVFADNRADLVGGGCLNGTDASPVYRDCFWIDNECGLYGRAMYNQIGSLPTLEAAQVVGCCEVVPPESFMDGGANEIEPTCSSCRADLNCYSGVGSADLGLLLGAFGTGLESYDLDGDGVVGGSDIGALVAQWGACPE